MLYTLKLNQKISFERHRVGADTHGRPGAGRGGGGMEATLSSPELLGGCSGRVSEFERRRRFSASDASAILLLLQ